VKEGIVMSIVPGHEDLQPREVIAFTADGHAVVQHGQDRRRYRLFMLPGGGIVGRPEQTPAPVDQLANTPVRRWMGVDQM
jgi:hypothetical protein